MNLGILLQSWIDKLLLGGIVNVQMCFAIKKIKTQFDLIMTNQKNGRL